MINYPNIDPVFLKLGPLEFRWYGLAYLLGISIGGYLLRKEFSNRLGFNTDDLINFLTYVMLGIFAGGRLGYILFYDLSWYINNPFELLAFWNGGMSFHGGFLGAGLSAVIFGIIHKKNIWDLFDVTSVAAPTGLAFGRLANFINGELYGRISDVPWAMVFPGGGPEPRHPSQLYEFFLEGPFLLIIMLFLAKKTSFRNGQLTGFFMIFYGCFRIFVELFREPDAHIGFLFELITMGQLLSFGMILIGVFFLFRKKLFKIHTN